MDGNRGSAIVATSKAKHRNENRNMKNGISEALQNVECAIRNLMDANQSAIVENPIACLVIAEALVKANELRLRIAQLEAALTPEN